MDDVLARLVVVALTVVCCLCILGVVVAAIVGHKPDPVLPYLAASTGGALVGILVPTGRGNASGPPKA